MGSPFYHRLTKKRPLFLIRASFSPPLTKSTTAPFSSLSTQRSFSLPTQSVLPPGEDWVTSSDKTESFKFPGR